MTPIDPATPASADPRSPMAPPYVDENPNLESVRLGMRVAENERRDLMADVYQEEARQGEDPSEALDDIDRTLSDGSGRLSELEAIHTRNSPGN